MKISIKGARVEKGMTQKQAGDAMNVTKETISNWERGKRVDVERREHDCTRKKNS